MSLFKFPLLELSIDKLDYTDIPIMENTRLNTHIIKIKQLSEFMENYGLNLDEGIDVLKEINNIDSIAISVDEATLIENPWLLNSGHRIVVSKLCEDSELYKITDLVLTEYFENQNSEILDIYLKSKNMNELICMINEGAGIADMDPSENKNLMSAEQANKVADDFNKRNPNGIVNRTKQALNQVRNSINTGLEATKQKAGEAVNQVKTTASNLGTKAVEGLNNLSDGLGTKVENSVKSGVEAVSNGAQKAVDFAKENPKAVAGAAAGAAVVGGLLNKALGGSSDNNNNANNQAVKDPGFWTRKLAAIKNWMNQNLGTNFDINQTALNWKPQNASVNDEHYKGISINEIYRPRRKYHVRYV